MKMEYSNPKTIEALKKHSDEIKAYLVSSYNHTQIDEEFLADTVRDDLWLGKDFFPTFFNDVCLCGGYIYEIADDEFVCSVENFLERKGVEADTFTYSDLIKYVDGFDDAAYEAQVLAGDATNPVMYCVWKAYEMAKDFEGDKCDKFDECLDFVDDKWVKFMEEGWVEKHETWNDVFHHFDEYLEDEKAA